MSNINKQPQSLDKIAGVQDISHENAAACSGGALTLWSESNHTGVVRSYTSSTPDLGSFNNQASSFEVGNNETWRLWTLKNYGGSYATLGGYYKGTIGPFSGIDNNVESVQRLQ
jgi:hypothetical protein